MLGILPGSRRQEVRTLLPLLQEAVCQLVVKERFKDLRLVVLAAPGVSNHIQAEVASWPVPTIVVPGSLSDCGLEGNGELMDKVSLALKAKYSALAVKRSA